MTSTHTHRHQVGFAIIAACSAVASAASVAVLPFPNPRADGKAGGQTPRDWSRFSTDGKYEHAVDTQVFHSAPSSARIRGFSNTGRACVGMRTRAFAPTAYYRLTFRYRTDRARTLRGFVRFYDGAEPDPRGNGFFMHHFSMRGRPGEWQQFAANFKVPDERRAQHKTVSVGVVLYGDPGGAVWFDDVDFGEGEPPPPNPLEHPITKLKALHLDTCLVRDGEPQAVLAIGAHTQHAELIQRKIEQCTGATLPVVRDLKPKAALTDANVIAIGNLATSPFIEAMYREYYTYLDQYYPGRGGYVLRSVHSPYGTGNNVLLVGGSDDAGVGRAVDALLAKLEPGKTLELDWTMEIKLGEGLVPPAPGEKVFAWCNFGGDRSNDKFFGWNPIAIDLALYYMTGDPAYVDDFRRLVFPKGAPDRRLFDGDRMFGNAKHPLATVYHYRGHITPLIWDLVEESPVFTDAERLYMTNELLDHQKHLHLSACERFAAGKTLPDRHAIYEIVNVWTGSHYFSRSYPDPVWDKRVEVAEAAFALSMRTPASSTPRIQTGTVIWPVQELALYSGAVDYFRPGGVFAQRMDKWLFLGDEAAGRSWNYQMLHAAAHTLKDGRFLAVRPIATEDLARFRIGQSYLSGVEPKKVTGTTGLRAFSMCEPNHRRLGMNVPLEEAFEFLVYRSSLAADKQHLFLYGYYEGSKSPPRVNAILNYESCGVRLLRTGQRSGVTVLKDGMRESAPSNAAALKCLEEIGPLAYSRTEVPDHDFSRWERSLFIVRNRGLVVFDRIVAREDGSYEIFVEWHPASSPKPGRDGLRWTSSGRPCAILTAEDVSVEKSRGGVTSFVHRGVIKANQGRLTRSLLAIENATDSKPAIHPLGASAAVLHANGLAVVGQGELSHGSLAARAEAFLVSPETCVMVRGTQFIVPGTEIRTDRPASFGWDLATGDLTLKAYESEVKLTLSGAVDKAAVCPAGQQIRVAVPASKAIASGVSSALRAALKQAESARAPSSSSPPAGEKLPVLGKQWCRSLGSSVTAIDVCSGGILAGTSRGTVHLLRPNGAQRWQFATGGPVYTVTTARRRGKRICLVGSDDEHVYAFGEDGKLLWKYKARVSEWMAHNHNYWTMGLKAKVRKIVAGDVEGDGKLDIFIGTGGSAIERLDEDGKPKWLFTFLYGTPMSLVLADVRADHAGQELLAGAFDCAYHCVVRYVDPATGKELSGAFVSRYPSKTDGPKKREPSSFAQGNVFMKLHALPDGRPGLVRAVCGRNWNNLVMNDAASGACRWGKSFGPGGGRYLDQSISSIATPDLNGDGLGDVVAGLRNAWVCAFDGPTGKVLWSTRMTTGVSLVVGLDPEHVIVGCEDGAVRQLDRQGRPVRQARLSLRPQVGAFLSGDTPCWIVGTRGGDVVALSPDQPDAEFGQLPSELPFRLLASPGSGKASQTMPVVGIGDGRFVAAAVANSKSWVLTLPPGTSPDRRPVGGFRLRGSPVVSGTSLSVLAPDPAKIHVESSRITLEAAAAGPFAVRVEQDAVMAGYRRGTLIERDRWGNMRTNGPVAKTLFNGRMAFFMGRQKGDRIDFDLAVPTGDDYEVWACFCKYRDRATFEVLLDGTPLTTSLDLYSRAVEWTKPILLGRRKLTQGTHVLRFEVAGRNAASSGYFMGLESIALVPVGQGDLSGFSSTTAPDGLRVDWQEGKLGYAAVFRERGLSSRVTIGNIDVDADACSVGRRGGEVIQWELRNGRSLRVNGQKVVELPDRRDACWEAPR